MKLQLIKIRDVLTDSFWFLPALMALLAAGAALGSVAIDQAIGSDWVHDMGWVWSGGAEGARSVLSVVAGSIMTVVSIVFSLTVTALAQTSSHFGPRVLRNFTSDRGVQFTLGTFIATFVYSLLVLRTVRSERSIEESSFVPYLSVNIGMLLALASLAVLIYFIHHVSQNIQAENLIADVGTDFQKSLPVLFPEHIGQPQSDDANLCQLPDEGRWQAAHVVTSSNNGYLQGVDDELLMRLAAQHDLILKLEKRPGAFVTNEEPLLRALPASSVTDDIESRLQACFSLGRHRTPHQDALYIVQQLVEIAAHALSPGINEPYTALTCIDWLGASLRGVARRELPTVLRQDEDGRLRVVACTLDFEELAHAAFDQIRLYGADNPDVMLNLLKIIAKIAPDLHRDHDRTVLVQHARLIGEDAAQIVNETDRRRVADCLQKTLRTLVQSGS
ncbi:DUF2254 domain-containing protein [Methylobacter luteus]|uniref:DUF2254 domain-containing protein n=1 Tax=Methylobacter luteus TaxID=415 RepID=UPI00041E0484|nr:DUF2254 domain-containing protein [Methylobacter luteus]